jgi:hypothetical protein
MWYDPIFQAYRTDRFNGYAPQPEPEGDLLQGYGGPSDIWTTLTPISASGGGGDVAAEETRGIPPAVWLGGAALIVIIVAVIIVRGRRPDEDEA